jgi:hypothetical protein
MIKFESSCFWVRVLIILEKLTWLSNRSRLYFQIFKLFKLRLSSRRCLILIALISTQKKSCKKTADFGGVGCLKGSIGKVDQILETVWQWGTFYLFPTVVEHLFRQYTVFFEHIFFRTKFFFEHSFFSNTFFVDTFWVLFCFSEFSLFFKLGKKL